VGAEYFYNSPPHGFSQPKEEGGVVSGEQGAADDAGSASPATARIRRADPHIIICGFLYNVAV
jgi:hypothetical protein